MSISSIQTSTVSLSFQYSSLQLSANVQSGVPKSADRFLEVENDSMHGHDAGHGRFRGLMQSIEATFSQLGFDLNTQQGSAITTAADAQASTTQTDTIGATGNTAMGNEVKQALHAFMHALVHALKSMGSEDGHGEQENHRGDRDPTRAVTGSSVSASYTSISFNLSLLVSNLDTNAIPTTPSLVGTDDTVGASVPAATGSDSLQNRTLSRLQKAFANLLDTLKGSDASTPQTSLVDFLKELQKNAGSHAQQEELRFSMSITTGSFLYTQA